jgi:hypothetical protein
MENEWLDSLQYPPPTNGVWIEAKDEDNITKLQYINGKWINTSYKTVRVFIRKWRYINETN